MLRGQAFGLPHLMDFVDVLPVNGQLQGVYYSEEGRAI